MRPVLISDLHSEQPASPEVLRAFHRRLRNDAWEVEIGFGKGRFLLDQAASNPGRHYLGLEVAAKYYRLVRDRARNRGLENVTLICGEAAYVVSGMLPREFAQRVHVYFPDPWPKDRHARRRLLDPVAIDFLVGLLRIDGELFFASDHPAYGPEVVDLLKKYPALEVEEVSSWPEGARTNYEMKFERLGAPIRRLSARRRGAVEIHPRAARVGLAWERGSA